MSNSSQSAGQPGRRSGGTLAALVVGLPLAAGLVWLLHFGPLKSAPIAHYVEHPVQWVVLSFFCIGMSALFLRGWGLRAENAACWLEILPRYDGKPMPVAKAHELLASVQRQPDSVQDTFYVRRLRSLIEFVGQRKSAADIDEQMRNLADGDSLAMENSLGLIRFITWAIPILGFLGTVLGITGAISGVTPEALEVSMAPMTDGLAEAFDSTALALGLTMIQMFFAHLVERQEQSMLGNVDRQIERALAHRFQRDAADASPVAEVVRVSSESLAGIVEATLHKQVELWATALGEPEKRAATIYQQVQSQFTKALGQALDQTAEAYAQRLATLEKQALERTATVMQELGGLAAAIRDTGREQQETLRRVVDGIAGQADVMGKLQRDANDLVHLQAVLHQNLAALASSSNFEEAVHSLTAAVHLLTARAGVPHHGNQGKAA